jgi:hypothetical protein
MLADNIVTAVMAASVTGAGLVIAFYALLAHMSGKIFSTRFEQLDERRTQVKQIISNPDSFSETNLKKTTAKLKELEKQIHSMKAFPQYLGAGVIISFALFIVTSFISGVYLTGGRFEGSDNVIMASFFVSLTIFAGVGIYGISDVNDSILVNFRKLRARKEEIKQEITNAPEESKTASKIESILLATGLAFERNVLVKTRSGSITPDLVIPSANNPKWLIEVWSKPTFDLVNRLWIRYMNVDENIKTIFVSNFQDDEHRRFAEAYFDYVIDFNSLETLKKVLIA